MKRILFAVVLLAMVKITTAQARFEALSFTPQFPKADQTVNFKFNSKLSSLIDEKKVDVVVYQFGKKGLKAVEPRILQNGTVYSGSFKPDADAACIAFGFSAKDGKLKDNNAGMGYFIPVYSQANQPVQDYYIWAGRLFAGYGESLFNMMTDASKNLDMLEEGLKANPGAKNDNDYMFAYLNAINSAKKKEGEPQILELLKYIQSKPDITEPDYNTLSSWYTRLKMKGTADSLTTIRKEKFPNGTWKKQDMASAITKGKDAESKKAAFEEYIKAYPPKEEDKSAIAYYRSNVASAYHKEKNYGEFKKWAAELPVSNKSSLYNDLSWNMALAKESLTDAKAISYEATMWAKKEMAAPAEKKPDSYTKKQWDEQRRYTYGMFADTYAFILYNTGEYKEGYPYAKEAAGISKFKNAEYNERYSQLMEKVLPPAETKKEIENLVKDGAASSKTKDLLKELYVKEKKSDKGYDEYLAKLEMAAKEKKREELVKTMINEEAPKFNLKDLDGNDITLVGLKGKVVVVDFWATWCGPCIASMPAMKTVQEKLRSRDDVAFVFVDTWESVDNKKQNASDFMTKNKYPFHVLLDDDSKVVADYKVNGIPTKFVIDKMGNIRFKSIGFGGNDDALIDEVSMMVDLASGNIPADKHVK